MHIKKSVWVPIMHLKQPDEKDEDDEEIPIRRSHSVRKPAIPDSKRKNIASSLEKTKKIKEP